MLIVVVVSSLDRTPMIICCFFEAAMNDDFNTPRALASLFEMVSKSNALKGGQLSFNDMTAETLARMQATFTTFIFDIFGLKDETRDSAGNNGKSVVDGLMEMILDMRLQARTNKDWGTSDKIRDGLKALEIQVKDGKDGATWTLD